MCPGTIVGIACAPPGPGLGGGTSTGGRSDDMQGRALNNCCSLVNSANERGASAQKKKKKRKMKMKKCSS